MFRIDNSQLLFKKNLPNTTIWFYDPCLTFSEESFIILKYDDLTIEKKRILLLNAFLIITIKPVPSYTNNCLSTIIVPQ